MKLYLVLVRLDDDVTCEYACGDTRSVFRLAGVLDRDPGTICYAVFGAGCTLGPKSFGWGPFDRWRDSGLVFVGAPASP